nr:hypothetical protein [Priestia megaterium]
MIGGEDGDSCGKSETGEIPAGEEATRRITGPRGKRSLAWKSTAA